VRINTILVQRVLGTRWANRLADDDRCGLTPLFWLNINPYGTFRLDIWIVASISTADPPPRHHPRLIRNRAVWESPSDAASSAEEGGKRSGPRRHSE
jgi:hypothetical protein